MNSGEVLEVELIGDINGINIQRVLRLTLINLYLHSQSSFFQWYRSSEFMTLRGALRKVDLEGLAKRLPIWSA